MDVKHEALKDFLTMTRSALSNICYSQGDIEVLDDEIHDLRNEISDLEEKLRIALAERARMHSAIKARDTASDMLAQMEAGETFVINVTN